VTVAIWQFSCSVFLHQNKEGKKEGKEEDS